MLNVLRVPSQNVYILFALTCVTGPTLGVVLGGLIIGRLEGGYKNKQALLYCFGFGVLASCFSVPVPFIDNYWAAMALMWLLLVCGGIIMPPLTGILISSAPIKYRAEANSVAWFIYNILGFLPSPLLYGYVCSITGG